MNEDLSKSAFFDPRAITIISQIVMGGKPSALTGSEQKLIKQSENIIRLNNKMDGQLVYNLNQFKHYIPVIDVIFFLFKAIKRGIYENAFRLLELCVRDRVMMTSEELNYALDDLNEYSPDWLINMLGDPDKDRHKKEVPVSKSTLNLDAMKKFK